MKLIKLLLFTFICATTFTLSAQDIHFSMFDLSPLTMNPAQTGAFRGSIRLGGIYRSQWASSNSDFATTSLYADAPIVAIGKKKRAWLGVGVSLVQDVAGKEKGGDMFGGLTTSFMMPSAAIHVPIDKKGDHVFTFGVQGGAVSRKLATDGLVFGDELSESLLGGMTSSGPNGSVERNNFTQKETDNGLNIAKNMPFTDISTGVLLTSKISEETRFKIGGALNHIVKIGGYNIIRDDTTSASGNNKLSKESKRPATIKLHATLHQQLSGKWSIHPAAFVQTTKGLTEMMIQSNVGYQLDKDIQLLAGGGFRLSNAAILMAGVNYKDWQIGLSYDLNVGKVATARLQHTFEIGASYIIKIYQEPKVAPVILCPKF